MLNTRISKYIALIVLVATTGCITPAADVVYINQTPNVVYVTATQTPTPDPCIGVICKPTCIGCDLYSTVCIGGYCTESVLLQEYSAACGCVKSTPVPTTTPGHNPRPSASATPPTSWTVYSPTTNVIDIERPIYHEEITHNAKITDIRVYPDLLIVGNSINIDIDVLNTGTESDVFCVKCGDRSGWNTIRVDETQTQTFKNVIYEAGDYTWYINLYYDPGRIGMDNVLLQNATVDVNYIAD